MAASTALTPMFRQYRALKQERPDSVLLFRMGDFYEMFYEDAQLASRLLELTLTARGKGTDNVVPMCGFPYHQLESYTARLVRARQRVAICEQVEDPRKARGLVRREIVRIVTPGTVDDPAALDAKSNHWLAAATRAAGRSGAAFLDASTGEFLAWEQDPADTDPWDALADRLRAFGPKEILHAADLAWPDALRRDAGRGAALTPAEPHLFNPADADARLRRHLGVASLDGFGLRDRPAAVAAAGALLQYVQELQRSTLQHIDGLALHEPAQHVLLDPATRRNLEIERNLRDGGRAGSLLDTVDATRTAGGGRLLRRWLLAPLLDAERIEERVDAVGELVGSGSTRTRAREQLEGVHDVERLVARAVGGSAQPRELVALKLSLQRLPELLRVLSGIEASLLRGTIDGLDLCEDVAALVARGIVDEPPALAREGGAIRSGFSAGLDELRSIRHDGRAYIASLERSEREATGIGSLKVRFNKVFGYFIEVSKANLRLVPAHYERKQTIANGERYVTPQLKEYETKVLQAQQQIEELELELFAGLRRDVAAEARRLKAVAAAVARLDVLSALAELAAHRRYCRPRVHPGPRLRIVRGRHPVVEQSLADRRFVPNETDLAAAGEAIAVLTGPNMGGKSTYLRQVALIVLLAQAGSFVPADEAEIGLVDRIFCRVGASDSLSEGQSTFMVEMTETANILRHASSRSLLLLDEIGRGTSTFDGLSIAWAVVESLAALAGGAPRTLFATHYHELTELAAELPCVVNLRMSVRESDDELVFLHRVERGASDRSYGIQVARLAGVPEPVVQRATEILANIERDEYGRDGRPRRARGRTRGARPAQSTLFEDESAAAPGPAGAEARVLAALRAQQPERLTPLEALGLLARWRAELEPDGSSER